MENWNEKLVTAAWAGNVEEVELCLLNDANIDYKDEDGWASLIWAAYKGHLNVTQMLLEHGCDKNTTGVDNETALLMADRAGHLEVTQLIRDSGCKKQARQSAMSKDATYIEDIKVPAEIKAMTDKTSVPLYLKLLESGSEKKRDVRLVIVGKKGAGKTSLIKRLICEDDTDIKSTNGIEIHKIKCKAKSDDGMWIKLQGNIGENEIHARLLKPYEERLSFQNQTSSEASIETSSVKNNTSVTTFDESQKVSVQTKFKLPDIRKFPLAMGYQNKPTETTKSQVKPKVTKQRNQSLEQAKMDIETMLKSNVDFHDKEEYATLLLWDFAGDEEFYHTHQTFLSSEAIYLVVMKLNEADDEEAQDLFRLWMDSIHCYSKLEKDKHDAYERTTDEHDPPVIIIGTWKDAVSSDVEEINGACRKKLLTYTEKMSKDGYGHIRCEHLISNTEDNQFVFQKIRQDIVNLSRNMRTWNTDYPLKFIQLEQRLNDKKKELPIISYHEIKHISSKMPNPLDDNELILYLIFHHEIRALVYFKDLPDYIILDTQWLSDAFKCIVTAEKFRACDIKHQDEWKEFLCKGKLHWEVVEDIFQKEQTMLYKHKDHVLNVMEKFDIIIHPYISDRDTAGAKPRYYVPCMIKEEPECDIYEMFNVTTDICRKSTWLYFKFGFLPPHLINHLIASLSRKYEVAEVATKQQKKQIALFRGSGVFELQKATKLRKLLVMKRPNAIQIQVWQFGKQVERGLYKYIADFVTEEITKIISTRFKMPNVKFVKKWECGHSKPESVTGSFDFNEDQETIYYCETCANIHEFTGEWSDLQHSIVNCLQSSETPNPYSESSSEIQTMVQSTKVRVRVQACERVFSNVNNEATGTASSAGFTKEEINFSKMGMIALNILAEVLYDLLKPDKPHLRPRWECDITYLYSEHRKLNKHIPSNSNHRRCPPGPWGGTWQDIQNTDIAIGDDIERIRLTRNELQHSKIFKLEEIRFNELCNILSDVLNRFDNHIKPTRLYTEWLNEILVKTISAEEVKSIENAISGLTFEVEIEN